MSFVLFSLLIPFAGAFGPHTDGKIYCEDFGGICAPSCTGTENRWDAGAYDCPGYWWHSLRCCAPMGKCPQDQRLAPCVKGFCARAKCSSIRGARCSINFCGKCKAEFFVDKRSVTDACDIPYSELYCEDLLGHCRKSCVGTWQRRPLANAPASMCPKSRPVCCVPKSVCPSGGPQVRCKGDPCKINKCPAYPNAKCHASYCGTCSADFYVNGRLVDCKATRCEKSEGKCRRSCFGTSTFDLREPFGCKRPKSRCCLPKSSRCPPGVPVARCFINPCKATKCPAFPHAECIANYCKGCNANFYVDDQLVTSACKGTCYRKGGTCKDRCRSWEKSVGRCPLRMRCCKSKRQKRGVCPDPRGRVGTCQNACNTDYDCPGRKKCCSNGCGRVCMNPKGGYKG